MPPTITFPPVDPLPWNSVGSGTGVGVAADSPAAAAWGAAVGFAPLEDAAVASAVGLAVESDEQAIATKRIKDINAKIGFISVLNHRAGHPKRRASQEVSKPVGYSEMPCRIQLINA